MTDAQRIEIVYTAIANAKEMIGLAYKPDDKCYCDGWEDIKDEKIKEYFYALNTMCIELADRNVMDWQKEV